MPVSKYMQTNVITASPSTPIWVAQRIILENKIRHLPVVEEEKLKDNKTYDVIIRLEPCNYDQIITDMKSQGIDVDIMTE